MQTFAVVRLLLVFIHVMAFALALGCVLREDAKLLSSRPIDPESLRSAARLVRFALIVLWASGTALLVLDTGGVLSRIADNPKMLAKLTVVCVLTVNGVALHWLAFPALLGETRHGGYSATLASALGAISAASWLAATLLGIVRAHAKGFDYADFMLGYAGMAAIALAFALLVVRPHVVRKLAIGPRWHDPHLPARPAADLPHLQ
ncbi:MAG: hypothetical protein GEV05_21215 [Betaproteobacteria bacterium]|nr:hypothetical protein [Betaproteobacteria bacterium]